MYRISVIIPTYKPQEYLWECLNSIREQTIPKEQFELIIVLNGLIEPYCYNIKNYIGNNFAGYNVQFLCTEFANVSNARNIALDTALGEYICFVDDDDILSKDYLEELLKISTKNIIGVSNVHSFVDNIENYSNNFFACKVIQQKHKPESLYSNRAILSFPVAKLIHCDIIRDNRFDPRFKNGEDALFMTKISDKIDGFSYTSLDTCYYVRERQGSATRRRIKYGKFIKDTFLLLLEYMKIYLSSPRSYNMMLFLSRIPGVLKGNINIMWRNRNRK